MARRKKKSNNLDKLKKILGDILVWIGKPFYFVFTAFFISLLFVIYFIQKLIGTTSRQIIYQAKTISKKRRYQALAVFFLIIFLTWYFVFRGLPATAQLLSRKINVTTSIYDRNGVLLYQIYKDQNRKPVNLSTIPSYVKDATLASEDANFYTNPGFSIKGIIRSALNDITRKNYTAGGSTITQQLVKNTLLSPEKTFTRKIKELVLALQVEASFSKNQILEMYLNEVSYGGSAYGIEAASELYFKKDVSKLDLAQAALIAGLPQSPTTFSPYGTNPDLAVKRQREVLQLMADNGFITKEKMNEALGEKIIFAPNEIEMKAPHFVMYVKQQLVNQYGEDIVESGGLNVITTLDYNIQKTAEDVVKSQLDKISGLHVTNGAAVVLDPATGEILAMVGSKDYFDTKIDGNVNVTTALRQPGSSIKIVNYAYALAHGYTPASILSDTPTKFVIPGQTPYMPVNYDGKFKGNVTVRSALAESRNIPAVKLLASYGVDKMIDLGQQMGVTTWKDPSLYGLSLTLGGGATRLIDMARVYATVANQGVRPPLISIKKVTDYKGKELSVTCDSDICDSPQVVDPKVAYLLIDILKDNNARAPEFGYNSSLVVSKHPEVAVKTGTSNDLKDNLTIGFNQKYLTAVWVGNNDNSSMNRITSGITGAAPIWNEIMAKILASQESVAWSVPDGLIYTAVGCPIHNEWFITGTQPKIMCTADQLQKIKDQKDKQGQILKEAATTGN